MKNRYYLCAWRKNWLFEGGKLVVQGMENDNSCVGGLCDKEEMPVRGEAVRATGK